MTTIKWLKTEIYPKMDFISYEDRVAMNKIFEKAIAMEKEQIVNTYKHGQNNGYMYKDVGNDIIDAEQYYNQTYFQNGNNL